MSAALNGLLYINDQDAFAGYGAFLSSDRRGELKNYSALLKPPAMKPYTAVSFREEDGEDLPEQLLPAFEARDVELQFTILASGAAQFLQRYDAFVTLLRSGWLELRLPELSRTFRMYYKSCSEFGQLTSLGDGTVAGKFKVKLREPKPEI